MPESFLIGHIDRLLTSFSTLVGRDLILRHGSIEEQSRMLFHTPHVVISHGIEDDPILNYGNKTALSLWEMTWDELVQTPSRKTAEPINRAEREQLLTRTRRNGYIDDYSGVRISRTGKRFKINRAIVWNISDAHGRYCGQAATFDTWQFMPPPAQSNIDINIQ
ncbi:MAG: MEKHLA domain-containing protein [Planctomycetaceae bacterium]|jgi:hypothetical protein|nr:MEKHLA domain-containing protein [Planctomycetaceae bacterium]MBT4158069.1 MEKHLA domain-containing protein [Planctomycetaceae bacterium]MBT6054067.1 MEKHLA domain-containing protein [Planctomycetaceae bacterium]MBT6459107.1 MEKHLA domain-containing protein [Planctomycetaceae bacterium]MBT6642028.1 MEKHLA domain-containing protein [Planctomycetaceae bacterium]